MKHLFKIFLFALTATIVSCSARPYKPYCESSQMDYSEKHSGEEMYQAYDKKCRDYYDISMDKDVFLKKYENAKKEYEKKKKENFIQSCTCEAGFNSAANHFHNEMLSTKRIPQRSLDHIEKCKSIRTDDAYQKGYKEAIKRLDEVNSKRNTFEHVWNGNPKLAEQESKTACAQIDK